MTARSRSKLFVVNTLAVFAYAACVLQWILVIIPVVPLLVNSTAFRTYFVPQHVTADLPPDTLGLPLWFALPLFVLMIIAMLVFVGVSLWRLPRAVGKTGQKVTHSTAKVVLPHVVDIKKVPEKKRRQLTARIVFALKLTFLAVPPMLSLLVPMAHMAIPREALVLTVAFLAGWALLLFCLQAVLARLFRIPLQQLW